MAPSNSSFFSFFSGKRPQLVESSLTSLGEMLDTAAEMFAASTAYLLDNEALTMDLSANDEVINEGEQQIRRNVLEHLAVDPREELVLSMILVSIVQDAERCGDLAKSIAKAADLAHEPRTGPHVAALRATRDRVQAMFPVTREAFAEEKLEASRRLMEEHAALKDELAAFLEGLASDRDLDPNLAVVLGVSSRMIVRVSSHLSNIMSAVALPFDQIRNAPTWG